MVKLLSHILCYFLLLSCCTRHQLWESRKSLFYCSVLCPCFLSLFLLLFKSRTTSSSTSSAYSNIHKAPAAYHAVPSGICALHKYLFASIAVLYRQRAREGGRACTPPPLPPERVRAIVFCCSETGSTATLWPTSRLSSTHPALNVPLPSHHASFCPLSLLLYHWLLFVLSLCLLCFGFFPVHTLSFYVLLPSSYSYSLLVFPLCVSLYVSAHRLTIFLSRPVLRILCLSPFTFASWGLCTGWSWWALPASVSWGRVRKVRRRTEGRSRRGQEPTPPGTGTQDMTKVVFKCVWRFLIYTSSCVCYVAASIMLW